MSTTQGQKLYITQEHNCPLYELNDHFYVQGIGLLPPPKKPVCIQLAEKLKQKQRLIHRGRIEFTNIDFMCGGCGKNNTITITSTFQKDISNEVQHIIDCIHQFSFFRVIPSYIIEEVYDQISITQYDSGSTIIKEGDVGNTIYVVVSGEVEVYLGGNKTPLATYKTGGIFGEMSLLSGNVCNATVETISETQLLCIKANTFYFLMERFPDLQKYFYRLLSSRFNKSNSVTATIDTSEIQGNLTEQPIIDILNILHKDKKSGRLEIESSGSKSYIDFLEGEIFSAYSENRHDFEALQSIMKIFEGTFVFHFHLVDTSKKRESLGEFMDLIMESLVR